jgi:Family of unknown function (DUF6476)
MTEPAEPVDVLSLLRARPDDTPNLRWLRYAVIGMGVVLALGFLAVIGRLLVLATRAPANQPANGVAIPQALMPAADIAAALPAGARVRSLSLNADRLAVHYDSPAGEGIAIIDLTTGRRLSLVRLVPEAAR